MLWSSSAAGSNYGNGDGAGNCGCEFTVKTDTSAVAIHGGEQDFSGAAFFCFPGPFQHLLSGGFARSSHPHLGLVWFARGTFAVDRDNHRLRAKTVGDFTNQFWIGNSGGIDSDLVGPGIENAGGILQVADTSTHGEGNKELSSCAANSIHERFAFAGSSGDIKQDNFIGAGFSMGARQLCGITGITQVLESNAFYDASGIHVQ